MGKSMINKIMVASVCLVASVFIAITFSGCSTGTARTGAGAGNYSYSNGDMKSVEDVSMDKLWNAAQKAVKEMGFVVESQSHDALVSVIEARGAGDKKITIKLSFLTEKTTEVKIRVGFFGNKEFSYQILKTIREKLS